MYLRECVTSAYKQTVSLLATNTNLTRLSTLHDFVDSRLDGRVYKFCACHAHVLIHQRSRQRVGSEQCCCRV